ncbi:alpha-mannosidase [Bifidobacterium aemilianum]|uniref:Alpha-mannosidase n=1 Tax=Bifidobacterium aemilianum TaxID=2493120 RepID=A0A366KA08_9BIFI|nr:alpha-mannosidase [Bifidobacterium aemilianum]RBP98544.1 alpha-mannosidase [Bifidobacterium aemilianum]
MFLKAEQQLERCKRVMRQRVSPRIHPVLSACKVRSFDIPGEPMPSDMFFQELGRGDIVFQDFTIGDPWGTTWGTVWFEISGKIPTEANEPANAGHPLELILDLGWYDHSVGGHIEGMVYRPDGTVIKSVHPRNFWVPLLSDQAVAQLPIAHDGSFTVYLEAASNPLLLGVPPFIETELGDHATGKPDEPYVFRAANLCGYDQQMEDYWLDLDTVSSLMAQVDKDSPRYWKMAKALQYSLNAFDEMDHETLPAARQALAGVLSQPANASAMKVTAVGHAHIDSAWIWPVRETKRKVARTVSNALALMDENPDFTYAMSSAQQYAWLEEGHPDLFKRMLQRVREGRFIPVGGMWVESDGMLPTGESLVRQISFGRRYFKEHLGVEPKGIWLPDSFGYTGAWPQIARRAGYEWFLTQKISWNDTSKFPHHSFMWEGIDGSRIFTHFPPSDTYAASVTAQELAYAERNFQDKDLADRSIMLYGYGDGGGGPTREMLGRARRFNNLEGISRVTLDGPDEFFQAAYDQLRESAGDEMPVWKGELYLELHRGTLTSQQQMKYGCRKEESLLRTVEYLCAAASLYSADYRYPSDQLDHIWKTLLLNQFHDILPGSGISWVHREAREQYARDLVRLKEIAQEACQAIGLADSSIPLLPQGRISQYRLDGQSWKAKAASSLPSSFDSQLNPHTGDSAAPETTARSSDEGTGLELRQTDSGSWIMSNGIVELRVDPDGGISSLVDLRLQRQLVAEGHRLGIYELMKDEPSVYDAWEIERDALLQAKPLEGGRVLATSRFQDRISLTVGNRFGKSSIETVISLRAQADHVDVHASIDWQERERFLKVGLPLALVADWAEYDSQYGTVRRPIVKNTPSDEAKFESSTNRFARIADGTYAVAVVNDSIYGSDTTQLLELTGRGRTVGTLFRLSLLSAPVYPDPRTDLGQHEFTWSLQLGASREDALALAAELNAPTIGNLPALEPLVSLENLEGLAIIDWVKLADDGSGDVIVRLYEALGGKAEARLNLSGPLSGAKVYETDLLEQLSQPQSASYPASEDLPRGLAQADGEPADGAPLSLQQFQLTTLRLRREERQRHG